MNYFSSFGRDIKEFIFDFYEQDDKRMVKKALLVGCNYTGTDNELGGCISDANNLEGFLQECHFNEIKKILDVGTPLKPTRDVLLSEFKNFLSDSKSGDILFLGYSGHGSQVVDRSGEEEDGYDECIVPLDFEENGMIIDDELRTLFQLVPSGVHVFVILDSCHSGTCLDLRYTMKPSKNGRFKLVDHPREYLTNADVYLLSGCTDAETSADVSFHGKRGGALTLAFLSVIRQSKTLGALLINVQQFIKNNHLSDQNPQVSGGRIFDKNVAIPL